MVMQFKDLSWLSADTVMNVYIKTMTEDDDKEVVAQACMSLADILKDYGYEAVEPCMSKFAWLHLVHYLISFPLKMK